MKGSTGTSTGIIINTRKKKRKSKRCNCKTCKFARIVSGVANCTITGDINVKKTTCKYYSKVITK